MQVRARVDRLDGRGRRAERMQDLVARRAVDVGAQPADLQLVRIRAAHVKTNRVSGRDAHSIGVRVNPLDHHRPVGRDGRGCRPSRCARAARTAAAGSSTTTERSRGQHAPAAARNSRRVGSVMWRIFSASGENPLDDLAVDVGQAEIAAGVTVRSAACGPGPAGAGSWRAGRGRGPCPRRRSSRSRRSCPR